MNHQIISDTEGYHGEITRERLEVEPQQEPQQQIQLKCGSG